MKLVWRDVSGFVLVSQLDHYLTTLHSRNPCISCQQHIIFGKTKRDDCSLENHAIKPPSHAVAVVVVGIAWALVPFCANTKNEQIFYKRNIETFFTCSFGALFVKPFITCCKIGALFFLLQHEFLIGQTQTLCTLKVIFRSWLELTSDFLYTNFGFKSVVGRICIPIRERDFQQTSFL